MMDINLSLFYFTLFALHIYSKGLRATLLDFSIQFQWKHDTYGRYVIVHAFGLAKGVYGQRGFCVMAREGTRSTPVWRIVAGNNQAYIDF